MALPSDDANRPSEPPLIFDSHGQALQRLVSRSVPQDELSSVIETVVSNVSAAGIVKYLQGNDAQTFVDIMDLACHYAISSLNKWFIDLLSNPLFLLFRRLIHSIFHNESEGNA